MQEFITQGTTPAFSFTLPFEAAQIKSFFITFRQGQKTVLEKNMTDCAAEEYSLSAALTQEETFLFDQNESVQMQVRLTDGAGHAFASPVFLLRVRGVLKGGEIL